MARLLPEPDPQVVAVLRAAGCVFAEEEAALLRGESQGVEDLGAMLGRRVGGEPLEQVLGWAEFCALRIRVAPGVFVPRRRTEVLVELAVDALRSASRPGARPVVVDLCCGTGAIGVAIVDAVPGVELHACDLDPDAVACARRNVIHGAVHQGDLFDALPGELLGRVDVLAVNTPYVPTDEIALMPPEARLHEHRVALDGGDDGLDLHRRVAAGASRWLGPGGTMLVETSARQAAGTAEGCRAAGFEVEVLSREEPEAVVVRAISGPRRSSGTMAR